MKRICALMLLVLVSQTGCDQPTAAAWNSAAYYTASAARTVAYAAADIAYWARYWW